MAESLTCVARYQRSVGASAERVWENVLDWEHLPWLHRGSFCGIERIESGSWGWRVRLELPPEGSNKRIAIELLIEPDASRYVARTTEGVGKGSEIWTKLIPVDDTRTDIEVEFHLPGVTAEQVDGLGAAYTALYTRLWDEDEAMMVRRSDQLARLAPAPAATRVELGSQDEVRARAPFLVEFGGRSYRVLVVDDALVAHASVCPHLLGPLEEAEVEGGLVTCPWHGYRFDVRSGACEGRGLRLLVAEIRSDPETGRLHLES